MADKVLRRYKIDLKSNLMTQSGVPCNMKEAPKVITDYPDTVVNCRVSNDILYVQVLITDGVYHPFKVEINCDDCEVCKPHLITVKPCDVDTDCDGCEICDPVKKVCVTRCLPTQVCDGVKCVDCKPGDCNNGKKCLDGECVCPPEAPKWNEALQKCVECLPTDVLEPCKVCVDGEIVDRDCGDWHCDEVKDDCVECTDETHCGDNAHCDDGECKCDDGYEEDENGDCVLKPECRLDEDCTGTCEVCDLNLICVEKTCEDGFSLNDECECEKDDPEECIPCDLWTETPEGYTCIDGCMVACSELSCDNDECSDAPGCSCNGTSLCGDSGEDRSCKDSLRIDKEACSMEINLQANEPCTCDPITALTEVAKDSNEFTFTTTLRKGFASNVAAANSLPLLGDEGNLIYDIASNELPEKGDYKFTVEKIIFDEINGYVSGGLVTQETGSLSGIDTKAFNVVLVQPEELGRNTDGELIKYIVKLTLNSQLEFPNNCKFQNGTVLYQKEIFNHNWAGDLDQASSITSSDERYPLVVFSRQKDSNSPSYKYRKVYVKTGANGSLETNLWGPEKVTEAKEIDNYSIFDLVAADENGGLWPGYLYTVDANCTCAGADSMRAVFCDTDRMSIASWGECYTSVYLNNFEPCPVNQDLDNYVDPDLSSVIGAMYRLTFTVKSSEEETKEEVVYIKHNVSEMYIYDLATESFVAPLDGYKFEFLYSGIAWLITGVKAELGLYLSGNTTLAESYEFTCPYTIGEVTPDEDSVAVTTDCQTDGLVIIGIAKTTDSGKSIANKADINFAGSTSIADSVSEYRYTIPKGEKKTFTAKTAGGCFVSGEAYDSCCDELTVSITNNSTELACGGDLDLVAVPSDTTINLTYKWTLPNGSEETGATLFKTGPAQSGTYIVTITDDYGCSASSTIIIEVYDEPVVTIDGYSDFCDGGSTEINISTDPVYGGMRIGYTLDTVYHDILLDSSGDATLSNIQTSGTYVFTKIFSDECEFSINKTVEVEKITEPFAQISVSDNTICSGNPLTITINGSEGAEVVVSNLGTITVPTGGIYTEVINPTATKTYVITSVSIGTCIGTPGDSETVVVQTGIDLELTDRECSADKTTTTYTFNSGITLTGAVDDGGSDLAAYISGNQLVDVPNAGLSWLQAHYDNGGSCDSYLTVNYEACECGEVGFSVVLNPVGSIDEGDTVDLDFTITGGLINHWHTIWINATDSFVVQTDGSGNATLSVTVNPSATTTYNCILNDELGCTYNTSIQVVVNSVTTCSYCLAANSGDNYGAHAYVSLTELTIKISGIDTLLTGEPEFNFPYCLEGTCTPGMSDLATLKSDFATWIANLGLSGEIDYDTLVNYVTEGKDCRALCATEDNETYLHFDDMHQDLIVVSGEVSLEGHGETPTANTCSCN